MIFEAEWEAGIPVEWLHAWLEVCGFLEQAKWHPTTFLCRDTNPFFVLILSVGPHSLSNIGLRLQLSLFYILRHFSLSVVCEEAPILASIAVGGESGGVVVPAHEVVKELLYRCLLSIHPSIHLPILPPTHPSIHPSIHASIQSTNHPLTPPHHPLVYLRSIYWHPIMCPKPRPRDRVENSPTSQLPKPQVCHLPFQWLSFYKGLTFHSWAALHHYKKGRGN